jgi:hypothetical protein
MREDVSAEAAWSPREALDGIEKVTRREASLRGRTEGLTWALWGLSLAGADATNAAVGSGAGAWGALNFLWIVVPILASIGLWRSGALAFNPHVSTRRAVLVFVGWQVLLVLASIPVFVAIFVLGLGKAPHVGALISLGILLLLFGAFNPLAFTPRGRWTGLALGMIAVAAGLGGLALRLSEPTGDLYDASVIGASWCLLGLYGLFRS